MLLLKGAVTDSEHATETGLYFAVFDKVFELLCGNKFLLGWL